MNKSTKSKRLDKKKALKEQLKKKMDPKNPLKTHHVPDPTDKVENKDNQIENPKTVEEPDTTIDGSPSQNVATPEPNNIDSTVAEDQKFGDKTIDNVPNTDENVMKETEPNNIDSTVPEDQKSGDKTIDNVPNADGNVMKETEPNKIDSTIPEDQTSGESVDEKATNNEPKTAKETIETGENVGEKHFNDKPKTDGDAEVYSSDIAKPDDADDQENPSTADQLDTNETSTDQLSNQSIDDKIDNSTGGQLDTNEAINDQTYNLNNDLEKAHVASSDDVVAANSTDENTEQLSNEQKIDDQQIDQAVLAPTQLDAGNSLSSDGHEGNSNIKEASQFDQGHSQTETSLDDLAQEQSQTDLPSEEKENEVAQGADIQLKSHNTENLSENAAGGINEIKTNDIENVTEKMNETTYASDVSPHSNVNTEGVDAELDQLLQEVNSIDDTDAKDNNEVVKQENSESTSNQESSLKNDGLSESKGIDIDDLTKDATKTLNETSRISSVMSDIVDERDEDADDALTDELLTRILPSQEENEKSKINVEALAYESEYLTRRIQESKNKEKEMNRSMEGKDQKIEESERKIKDLQIRLIRFARDDEAKDRHVASLERELKDMNKRLEEVLDEHENRIMQQQNMPNQQNSTTDKNNTNQRNREKNDVKSKTCAIL